MDVFCEFKLPVSYPEEFLPMKVKLYMRDVLVRHGKRPVSKRTVKSMAKHAGLDPDYTPLEEPGLFGLRLDHRGEQIPLIVRFEHKEPGPSRCPFTIDMFEQIEKLPTNKNADPA